MITTLILLYVLQAVAAGGNDCVQSTAPSGWDYGPDMWTNMLKNVCGKSGRERKSAFITTMKEAIVPLFRKKDETKYTSPTRLENLPIPSQDAVVGEVYTCANDGEMHPIFLYLSGEYKDEYSDIVDLAISPSDNQNDDNNYVITGQYYPNKVIYNVHTVGHTGNQRIQTDITFDSEIAKYTLKLSTANFIPDKTVGGECVVTVQDISFDPLPEPKKYSIGQFSSIDNEEDSKAVAAQLWNSIKGGMPGLIRAIIIQAIVARIPRRNHWICVSPSLVQIGKTQAVVELRDLAKFKTHCGNP